MVFEITRCRACNSKSFSPILSLGNQYVTNFVENESDKNTLCPLDLVLCGDCKLLQMKHNAPPESMWNEQYWYKSGISSTIKNDLKDIVEKSKKLSPLSEGDIVIDIGCNDGTLLNFYNSAGVSLVGFEPSNNVAKESAEKGINVINNFFNAENFIEEYCGKTAKIITAISMFYDLEDPNKFLKDIKKCLDKNGIFVIQQNYLVTMLEQNAFDNICHEHREYYSFNSLNNILKKHGLEIFDVEKNNINGGSIRTYIKFEENDTLVGFEGSKKRIEDIKEYENKLKLDSLEPYKNFVSRIKTSKDNLMNFLNEERKKGKEIYIYGASTRGNVILQYFGMDSKIITGAVDMNSDKWGKKTNVGGWFF